MPIDENLSEQELREKYFKIEKKNFCSLMTKDEDFNNFNLYENTINTVEGKVTCYCGDEKSLLIQRSIILKNNNIKY